MCSACVPLNTHGLALDLVTTVATCVGASGRRSETHDALDAARGITDKSLPPSRVTRLHPSPDAGVSPSNSRGDHPASRRRAALHGFDAGQERVGRTLHMVEADRF